MTALVFASSVPPFPLDNGARIRTHRLLTGIAQEFETTYVTYAHHPESGWPSIDPCELAERLPGVTVVTVPGVEQRRRLRTALAGPRSLLSRLPGSWRPYDRRAFERVLLEQVRKRDAAIVHFDHFAYFTAMPSVLNVRAPHNVESVIARQEVAHQRGYGRIWHEAEWRKLRALERQTLRASQLCVAVSEQDAHAFAAAGASRVVVCPNGTDPVERRPMLRRRQDEPLRAVFVGSGDYPPYARGLAWFVQQVLPRARERTPIVLDVVGRTPPRRVAAEGVRYHGRVSDVAQWYERGHVAIVPVFEGSGTRLKVVEAMAHGRPVISTRLGAEGLPVRAPDHFFEADTVDAFANALADVAISCQGDDPALGEMLVDARRAVEPLFWPQVVRELCVVYRSEIEARSSAAVGDDSRRPSITGQRAVRL